MIHDYLVEPIKIATQDASTRAEDAARALEAFVKEWRENRRTVIPLGKLTEIQRYAPPGLLRTRDARHLRFRSYVIGYGQPAALGGLAAMATVGAVGWASLEAIWVPGADWPQRPELGTQNLRATELGKSGVILLAPSSGFTQGQAAVFWDSDAGKQLRRIDGEGVFFGGDHLVDLRNTDQTLRIWNLRGVKSPEDVKTLAPDLRQIVLPGSTFDVNSYIENDSLVIEDIKNHAYRIYDLTKPAEAITANSIEINKVHFSPVVGRTKEYLFAASASHNSQNQWQLSILPKELGIADLSLEDELTYIGFKEAEEETELVVLTKSAQDTNIENFKILTKQIKSLGKRSMAIPSSLVSSFGRDSRYGFQGDLFIHYTFLNQLWSLILYTDTVILDYWTGSMITMPGRD